MAYEMLQSFISEYSNYREYRRLLLKGEIDYTWERDNINFISISIREFICNCLGHICIKVYCYPSVEACEFCGRITKRPKTKKEKIAIIETRLNNLKNALIVIQL